MKSAAVVIGVDRTGGLTPLEAAASGAREVAKWLTREGYDVTCLVDGKGRNDEPLTVTRRMIFDAVSAYVNRDNLDKLIIYFAGHGHLRSPWEIWLLSDAPDDPTEAVDQTTSVEMARSSNIPNVVFISDCCRSIPTTLEAQRVNGGPIFPNRSGGSRPTQVDQFYATRPGTAAIESQLPDWMKASGLFTRVLKLSHLDPPREKLVRVGQKEVVPCRWLQSVLPDRVDEEAQRLSLALTQRPDIRLETEQAFIAYAEFTPADPADYAPLDHVIDLVPNRIEWMTELTELPRRSGREASRLQRRLRSTPPKWRDSSPSILPLPDDLRDFRHLIRPAASRADLDMLVRHARDARNPATPPPIMPALDPPAWVSVEGAVEVRAVTAVKGGISAYGGGEDPIFFGVALEAGTPACSVAVELRNGSGTVVAALRNYVCRLKVGESGVEEIGYAPFAGPYADAYRDQHARIDAMRAVASAAAAQGLLAIDKNAATRLAQDTRAFKMFDPALGMVAALAYAGAGRPRSAASVRGYSQEDLGIDLFDIWLAAGAPKPRLPLFPFCPMVTQSWSYLDPRGVKVHPAVRALGRHGGFWTTFSPGEMEKIIPLLQSGEVE